MDLAEQIATVQAKISAEPTLQELIEYNHGICRCIEAAENAIPRFTGKVREAMEKGLALLKEAEALSATAASQAINGVSLN